MNTLKVQPTITQNKTTILKIDDLVVSYGKLCALDHISFDVDDGEIISIVGPSGSGKTTLLRSIADLIKITSGKVEFIAANQQGDVGMVFQQFALFPHMTIFDNIAYGLRERRIGKKEISERVHQIAGSFNISEKLKNKPNELSGGQQQRVALARSMILNPKILLLDEPFSGIDVSLRKICQEILSSINETYETTIIAATHIIEDAMLLSDRILLLNNGKIEQYSTVEDMINYPQSPFALRFLGNVNEVPKNLLQHLQDNSDENMSYYVKYHDVKPFFSGEKHHYICLNAIIKSRSCSGFGYLTKYQVQNTILYGYDTEVLHKIGDSVEIGIEKDKILTY